MRRRLSSSSRPSVRAASPRTAAPLAALALALLAGCLGALDGQAAIDDGPGNIFDRCHDDRDCVLAGPSCCDCPTYATLASSGWDDTCANVDCTGPGPGTDAGMPLLPTCTALVAQCNLGVCIAACAPAACDVTCAQGFATDAAGCLTCACNQMPVAPACDVDSDCVQVPSDCCGCARGGADTAVPRAIVDEHVRSLNCPANAGDLPCPDVSTCDLRREPRCRERQCALVGPDDPGWSAPPPGACGRPDLPACPDGQACVINRNAEAGPLGLGVCEPPSS